MKTRTLVSILILVLAVLFIAGSCATDKMTYISKEYEIYGTWVNPDYDKTKRSGKVVFHPNGKSEFHSVHTGASVIVNEEFVITNKWIDTKGNIFYTMRAKKETFTIWRYYLLQISNSGKTLEYDSSYDDYPKEIDPQISGMYTIYYRQ